MAHVPRRLSPAVRCHARSAYFGHQLGQSDWLAEDYARAWATLAELALTALHATVDFLVVRSALAAVALSKGATKLGAVIGLLEDPDIDAYLDEQLGWSEQYRSNFAASRLEGGDPRPAA
jgi:hypothetical protein